MCIFFFIVNSVCCVLYIFILVRNIALLFDWYTFEAQVIYRIKLPGPAILGEGKPENQNHAIIFTRGEGLQTIDMNQVENMAYLF